MKVVYTAPNRAHHYRYALEMFESGILYSFVSGFPRLSPRARFDQIGFKLHRADLIQTLYIASLKLKISAKASAYLAYLAKIEQDFSCRKFINNCDVFIFYNGSGLNSCLHANQKNIITIVEVVNCHVQYQEKILKEEYQSLNLPWFASLKVEKNRRLEEYKQANYILTPSEFVRKSFIDSGIDESKLLKVSYGFDCFPTREFSPSEKDFTVLYVGSISVRKGLRYLIEAFVKLKHAHKKLIIVGPKANPDGLHDISIPDNVIFTGILKGDDLQEAYLKADVFCLPSLEDGFGLVLGEAISYGIPIIATTNTGAHDIITDGKEGFIVPIRDVNKIYEKLQLLADDKSLLNSMKISALERSKELSHSSNLLTYTLHTLIK